LKFSKNTKQQHITTMLYFVDTTPSQPTVTHVIPDGEPVYGVTSLGNDAYFVGYKDKSQHIEVYDAATFTLQGRLTVPGLGFPDSRACGLAVCPVNNCLYASDWQHSRVHRVELSGSNAVMKWSVARHPAGLTVNRAQNVLVVSYGRRKLQEFTTRGILLQNIQLRSGAANPWHAVDMANGQFVVSYREIHDVCLVNREGAVVRRYRGQTCSEMMKMKYPMGLAVDRHGNILVANEGNKRLLVLDNSLTSAHKMYVSVDGGLRSPRSLSYDKSHGRLYIGEWDGGRVIVIDHLKDFTTSHV